MYFSVIYADLVVTNIYSIFAFRYGLEPKSHRKRVEQKTETKKKIY